MAEFSAVTPLKQQAGVDKVAGYLACSDLKPELSIASYYVHARTSAGSLESSSLKTVHRCHLVATWLPRTKRIKVLSNYTSTVMLK